ITPQLDRLTFDGERAFAAEIDAFVSAVRGEGPELAPAAHGREVARVIEAVYESARTGEEIAF
ncbi:MAG: Gfo/Idh/MocA family oxidoreductase, partial [Microbacterium sp.]